MEKDSERRFWIFFCAVRPAGREAGREKEALSLPGSCKKGSLSFSEKMRGIGIDKWAAEDYYKLNKYI